MGDYRFNVRFDGRSEVERRAATFLQGMKRGSRNRFVIDAIIERMPVLCIGRNTAYELVRSGQIRSIRVGRNIRVPKEAVAEYLSQQNN